MNFLSLAFLGFVILTFLIYWNLPHRLRAGFLTLASLFYYGVYSPTFLAHFIAVIGLNFVIASALAKNRSRSLVTMGVILNLLHLIFFKYFNSLFALLLPSVAAESSFRVIMPLAISFYTFQFIAFQVDCYRGQVSRVEPVRYALFMLFFPHLISGPILRSGDLYSAIGNETESREMQNRGLYLIALGLFKKLLIADVIGYLVNPVFKSPGEYGTFDILAAILGYTVQLYCDFSGFIDIARGISKLFGYDLPVNFRSPYFAASFSEFWNRWHITLSRFIRDYIYIPLGGNRVSPARQYFNLMLAMVLSGLWHGETLNFLLWGALHGAYLAGEKLGGLAKEPANRATWLLRNLWVVGGWAFSLVFFRAADFPSALTLLRQLASFQPATLNIALIFALIVLAWLVQYAEARRETLLSFALPRAAYLLPLVLVFIYVIIIRIQIPNEAFIYVQF
jgi:D-alanyl-lipoteichoic acid acyltransferase DltB (MBOAT superfamily)